MKRIHYESTSESESQSSLSRATGSWRGALFLVVLAATAVVAPMFFLGNVSGHDFQFHVASWMDVAGQWHEGIVYPRWAEWANWGFGEPRFVFYPPASWMLGAALGCVLPWKMVPGAFIWLALIAAGAAMWKLAREWLPGPQAAAAAVLFAANPYHLIMVYYRSDFAELLASAFFPLMLGGVLDVVREGWRRVPLLAIAFAGIWLSNAPAGVIATYSLVMILATACAIRRSLRPLVSGSAAVAAGFGLAAFYILPAAWEQRWVQIAQVIGENLRPEQNFLFTHANDPDFVLFNWKVSGVAIGVILLTGLAAGFSARRRRDFPGAWWMLVALAAASVFLMFPPSALLWRYLPKLRYVQFPWRWLVPLDLTFAFFVPVAIGRSRKRYAWWVAVAVVIGALGVAEIHDAWWDSEDVPSLAKSFLSGHGYEGTDEYQPLGCDRYNLPEYSPRIAKLEPTSGNVVPAAGVRLRIKRWSAEDKDFSTESAAPVTLALRLLSYPAWEVRVDGRNSFAQLEPQTGQLTLPLPAGTHHVGVRFQRTWDRSAGSAISIVFAFTLLAVAALSRRRSQIATH